MKVNTDAVFSTGIFHKVYELLHLSQENTQVTVFNTALIWKNYSLPKYYWN